MLGMFRRQTPPQTPPEKPPAAPIKPRSDAEVLAEMRASLKNRTIREFVDLYLRDDESRRRLDMGVRLAGKAKIMSDLVASFANAEFAEEDTFQQAYEAGWGTYPKDLRWRFNTILEMAQLGLSREGVFVEAGVHEGNFMFGAARRFPEIGTSRALYLFDTFEGVAKEQLAEDERGVGTIREYESTYLQVIDRFSGMPNIKIIKGVVPSTLDQFTDENIAFLHIDMNVAYPEVEALKFFWPRMSIGAPIVLDDYGFPGHEEQKHQIDALVKEWGRSAMLLPTGQGLLIK